MSTRSKPQTGHVKNVENLEDLIVHCKSFGSAFNPSRSDLQIGALETVLTEARAALAELIDCLTVENNAINHRANLFKDLPAFMTRIVSALAASGANQKTIEDARGILRKIRGGRASKKTEEKDSTTTGETSPDTETEQGESGATTAPKQRSSSQQSYDLKMEHVARLVSLLQSEPKYLPNEKELQLSSLQNYLQELRNANTMVATAKANTEATRRNRNRIMYHLETGLVVRALQVKMYIKSVFGSKSPEYKKISRIAFRKLR